jgi:S1-C subfamily serine protease
MFCIQKINGHTDIYHSVPYNQDLWKKYPHVLIHHYNSCVYGFEYIYRHYKERTFPVIATTENGQSMGSCFRIYQGIATAKHCLTDGRPIAIRGYSKEQLDKCSVFVSNNPDIDIAFIHTDEIYLHNNAEPRVLDNVLVMGYPKIPLFLNFCTGEKANISAIADLRLTPTIGSIAAEGEIYFPKNLPKMLLVTAKMKGGNSGGPVINEDGYVVGIATGIPDGEGLSDDHVGYGIAYPIQVLDEIIKENHKMKVEFMDFPE